MFKIVLASILFTAACAAPAGPPAYHAPAPAYHAPVHHAPAYHAPAPAYHAPVHHAPAYHAPAPSYHEPKYEPRPYHYAYGVSDDYTGTNFEAAEDSDGGYVNGHYSVLLPDGRRQNVKYTADHYTGYVADVSYEGYAAHAPIHKAAPAYHVAPVHKPVYHPAPVHNPVYHPAPVHKPAPYHG